MVQFPYLRTPFGLSGMTDNISGNTSYSVDLSLDLENPEAEDLLNRLVSLDEHIIKTVHENSKEYLGKSHKIDVLKDALYRPIARQHNPQYAPLVKLKVPKTRDGDFISLAFNSEKQQVDIQELGKGQKLMSIVEFGSVYIIDGKFGVTMKLSQAMFAPSTRLNTFAFRGVEEDTIEDECFDEEV